MSEPTKVSIAGIAPVTIVADTRPEKRWEYRVVGLPSVTTKDLRKRTSRGADVLGQAIDPYATDG